jgi:ATP phosphoribosyltransferase
MSATMAAKTDPILKLVVPKGRLLDKIELLLNRIGLSLTINNRSYRPICADPEIEVKFLKPQNIPSLIALGRHDCGFTGLDWVIEEGYEDSPLLTECLDLQYNPVRIVAAVPEHLYQNEQLDMQKNWIVASEYRFIAKQYLEKKGLKHILIKTYGATEALPPDDADMIIDNTSTGSTLMMNRLAIVEDVMRSTTRFIANSESLKDIRKKEKLDQLVMLMKSTLLADKQVLLEMNVSQENFAQLVAAIPSMKSPTVSPLFGDNGYAVKISVPKTDVPALIPKLLQLGARDILEYKLEKIVR